MVTYNAFIPDVEIRGVERKNGSKRDYQLVRFDFMNDTTGEVAKLPDFNLDHIYRKGIRGNIVMKVTDGKYIDLEIKEFIESRNINHHNGKDFSGKDFSNIKMLSTKEEA